METGTITGRRKLKLPFRIGTTSYVWPAGIMPNVRRLKGLVDDVELVLFESEQSGNIPGESDLKELKKMGRENDLTYTVHLPLDLNLGSRSEIERSEALDCVKSLTRRMSAICPRAFILHLNLPEDTQGAIPSWQEISGNSLKELSASGVIPAERIAVENLSYPFAYAENIVLEHGFSICADIGHLIVTGADPLEHLNKYFDMIRVIHLHGVDGGKDHTSLKYLDPGILKGITGLLNERKFTGVLTLEVFAQRDFEESMEILWENLYS